MENKTKEFLQFMNKEYHSESRRFGYELYFIITQNLVALFYDGDKVLFVTASGCMSDEQQEIIDKYLDIIKVILEENIIGKSVDSNANKRKE
jgi:hypothetical protein